MQNSPTGPMIKQVSQNAQIKIIFVLLWTGNRVLANFLTVQPSPALEFVFFLAHMRSSFGFSLFSPAHQQIAAGNKERDAPRRGEDAHRFSMHIERERGNLFSTVCWSGESLSIMQITVLAARSPQMTSNLRSKQGNLNNCAKNLIPWGCLQTIDLIFNILSSENRTPKKRAITKNMRLNI